MKDHEQDWLDYAWRVVDCGPAHAQRCEAAGGMGMPGGTDARFPGFVGPDFERGRSVLCMAHVHRYLPNTDDVPGGRLDAIEAAIVGWRLRGRSPGSDATFVSGSQPAYIASAAEWPWRRKHFQPLLNEGRVPMAEVAFANFAKCRTVTDEDSGASQRRAELCAQAYPPAALIEVLRPVAVLIASVRLDVGEVGDVLVIRWNGRNGLDDKGNRMSTGCLSRAAACAEHARSEPTALARRPPEASEVGTQQPVGDGCCGLNPLSPSWRRRPCQS